ncbi:MULTISPECIES: TetR-like C-terminal domain-containing protein [unclassified Amycolatopsis]|uniref:TetR-like C-terminal domain-containing protein n=1 Tax=unclassified Amycolatopsis TaxID=2618356 RepID=UPI002E12460D|nr:MULTISPECIES: TetR/AcrR family transcriptional regulator [unclassified Amycolatopsis]WSK76958.1 TetR/AcrR family transcriptional regulator [Amycolatopsis sp. NBC_01286]
MPDTRRRGDDLVRAIYASTLAELAEAGFAELSFEKIALRAHTGKAALYRRWSTPAELVLAALTDPVAGFGETPPPGTGDLRTDLLVLLGGFARVLDEPHGRALVQLITQRRRHPALFERVRDLVFRPRQELILELLGETGTARLAAVGPRLVLVAHIEAGPVSEAEVAAIVDEVLLPLVG